MSERFPRLTSLPLPPGHCFVCRKAAGTGFTDLGVSDDWLGAFYLCDDCLVEMAHGLGMRTLDEVAEIRTELGSTRIELSKALGELTQLNRLRALLREYRDGMEDDAADRAADIAGGARRGARRRHAEPGGPTTAGPDVGRPGGDATPAD